MVDTRTERSRFSRLLLVDDNRSLLTTLAGLLEEEGFTVTSCVNAVEALQRMEQMEFGVAVVDLRLPDMQGTQLLQEFKDLGSHVRVIINTAFGEFESARDAVNVGAFAYVEKAGDPSDLISEVHRAYRSHFERYTEDLEAAVAERTAELSESEKRLRLLFEHAPVCLWHEDFSAVKQRLDALRENGVEDFREYFETHADEVEECARLVAILDINSATTKLHNASEKEELTDSLLTTFNRDSLDVFREELIALASGELSFESDTAGLTLDGKKKDMLLSMFIDPGSPNWSSVYVAVTDITERNRLDVQRVQLQDQLRHAQKMDAVGQLAAGVAHEFNNMLVGILGNAQFLLGKADADLPESWKRPLTDIERAGTRAAVLTNQLLSFARKKTSNITLVNVNQVISDSTRMHQRLVGPDIKVRTELSTDQVFVRVDEGEVEQAVTNLVMNARDAMSDGGTLTIQTECLSLAVTDVPPDCKPGSYIRLSVTDNGNGMSPEVEERIFEPFFTTKSVGSGTGLGLSTVFSNAASSGGFVTVESVVGEGTVIGIHLPHVKSVVNQPKPELVRTNHPVGGSETILVCDDEDVVLASTTALLETLGYVVIAASGPREAIKVAAAHKGPIALLLTDMSMPDMDGIQLSDEIARIFPNIRRVLTSGYAEDSFRAQMRDTDRFDFMQKPASYDLMARTIRNSLDKSLAGIKRA